MRRNAARSVHLGVMAALALGVFGPPARGVAQPYVYPQQGQGPEQQQRDQGECHQWAVQQTGWNPATASTGGKSGMAGSVVRGGAGGAAVGAVVGAIAGDAGKGAAAGAAGGALIGGLRNRSAQRERENTQAQGQEQYLRAYTACLQGRGYSVN